MSIRPCGDSPVLSVASFFIELLLTEAQLKRIDAMQLSFGYVQDEESLNLLIEAVQCFLNDNFPDADQRNSIKERYFKEYLPER